MESKKLIEVIKVGETHKVEFKQSFHSSQTFSKLICGFANSFGGMIIIGVSDKKEILGVKENVDIIQQKVSAAAESVSPAIVPKIEVKKIGDKLIVSVIVQKVVGDGFHTFGGVVWVRIGSTLRKVEGNQLVDFLRKKQILNFDELVSKAKLSDLDEDRIRGYLKVRGQEGFLRKSSIKNFLLSQELALEEEGFRLKNVAVLFFAKEIENFCPQIEIKLVQFEGVEPVKILSYKLIKTNIIESIERSIAFVKDKISKKIEISGKLRNKMIYDYPIDVVREAIINAIVHRDYFSKDSIQIYIFNDRIEITNPGSIPMNLPRELFGTLSVRRNPDIYRLLRDYGYIEGLGSGIARMKDLMRESGLRDPVFGIYDDFFRVVVNNKKEKKFYEKDYEDLNDRQKNCLKFLKKNKSISSKKYMERNEVSYGTANSEINELVRFGYIKKIGLYKGAYYVFA